MGLLQKLKSALGLNGTGSSESGRSGDVDVTVEREPSTEDEDAVKGTETASSGTPSTEPDASETTTEESDDESAAPAADEFELLADDDAADETDEVDDAATEEAEESSTDAADETDATDNAATGEADDAGADTEGSTDPVTELNGIGPAYGDRLGGAGIETVGELAGADPAELADRIDLGESRVAGWVEQANDY